MTGTASMTKRTLLPETAEILGLLRELLGPPTGAVAWELPVVRTRTAPAPVARTAPLAAVPFDPSETMVSFFSRVEWKAVAKPMLAPLPESFAGMVLVELPLSLPVAQFMGSIAWKPGQAPAGVAAVAVASAPATTGKEAPPEPSSQGMTASSLFNDFSWN